MKKLTLSALSVAMLAASAQASAANLFSNTTQLNAAESEVVQRATVAEQRLATLNSVDLSAEKTMTIQLSNGKSITFNRTQYKDSAAGSQIWTGSLASLALSVDAADLSVRQNNMATIVQNKGQVYGTIRVNGELYKIRPINGQQHAIEKMDLDNMPKDHDDDWHEVESAAPSFQPVELTPVDIAPADQIQASAARTMKALVVYTASAKSQAGNISALIDLAMTETNQGYSNSSIDGGIELVHSYQISYTESSSSATDTSRLAGKSDGYMDDVHAKRDQYGADLVLLVEDVNGSCGRADAIMATASDAFAIVDWDCATGYYSTGHEIGHLLGARHDPAADPTNSPYAYGHGYRHPNASWRTVMAYNCSPSCTRINWWSNPNKYRSGDVMGTTTRSDNARVLNTTIPTIAAFRGDGSGGGTGGDSQTWTSLSASSGNWVYKTFAVASGASTLTVNMSGGTGDADLYLRYGSNPTTSSYTCRPYKYGNTESCTVSSPTSGNWKIGIRAYSTYSGVTVTAAYN
jgi:hypothetical protein